jgi:hypothetical protein
MRIRMLKTVRGSPDGFSVHEYRAGEEYELADTGRGRELSNVLLREGWAEPVGPALAVKAMEDTLHTVEEVAAPEAGGAGIAGRVTFGPASGVRTEPSPPAQRPGGRRKG